MKLLDMLASQNLHDQCPRLKVCAKTNNSKNAQNPQKTATIGTLSLVFRVSRAPIIKMWCLSQQLDKILLPKKISRRNIEKSPRYSQKTSKIMDILYTTPPIMITWQASRADTVLKIVLKVVQEDFGNKRSSWLHLPFFSRNYFRLGGVVPSPPQMLLTVKTAKRFIPCVIWTHIAPLHFVQWQQNFFLITKKEDVV